MGARISATTNDGRVQATDHQWFSSLLACDPYRGSWQPLCVPEALSSLYDAPAGAKSPASLNRCCFGLTSLNRW